MITLLDSYRHKLFQKNNLLPNIISGVIVGIVALPLAMAFAIASGVKPEQGIYTSIIAGICVSIFGGSRVQIAGPTGAFVVILASITAEYGVDGLQIATLLAGFILLFMGKMQLGNVIKFIPYPVIVGFTSGIGVLIFVGAWKDFFGLHVSLGATHHFHQKLLALISSAPHLNLHTTSLALLSLFLILVTPKINKRVPGSLVAIICITALQAILQYKDVATIGSAFGKMPNNIPMPHVPHISFDHLIQLIGPAFSIAMLGAIESLLSAVVADGMAGTRHNSNQELIGQGLANILAPLFGGFAATGAIARTATNIRNGGNSPLSGIIHSVTLLLILVVFAQLAAYIPLCVLAAILFVVSYNMSELHRFIFILKNAPHHDILVLLITCVLTIFTDLVIAINIGVILATLLFTKNMAKISISRQDLSPDKQGLMHKLPHDVVVYSISGPFFFGSVTAFENIMLDNADITPKIIIFSLQDVPVIDITAVDVFYKLIEQFNKRNVQVYLCEANDLVTKKLLKAGMNNIIAGQQIFPKLKDIVSAYIA